MDRIETALEPVKTWLQPLTDQLPPAARDFLNAGGWWLVFGLAILLFLLAVRAVLRRVGRALFGRGRGRMPKWVLELQENLAEYPLLDEPTGQREVLVKNLPARLRLVVMAPAGREADVDVGMAGKLLDWIVPGLGEVTLADQPRLRVWPPQYSYDGFATAFLHHTKTPDPPGYPSHWVLVAGRIQVGRKGTFLGLAFWTPEASTIGRVKLRSDQWMDVLRIDRVKE